MNSRKFLDDRCVDCGRVIMRVDRIIYAGRCRVCFLERVKKDGVGRRGGSC